MLQIKVPKDAGEEEANPKLLSVSWYLLVTLIVAHQILLRSLSCNYKIRDMADSISHKVIQIFQI